MRQEGPNTSSQTEEDIAVVKPLASIFTNHIHKLWINPIGTTLAQLGMKTPRIKGEENDSK